MVTRGSAARAAQRRRNTAGYGPAAAVNPHRPSPPRPQRHGSRPTGRPKRAPHRRSWSVSSRNLHAGHHLRRGQPAPLQAKRTNAAVRTPSEAIPADAPPPIPYRMGGRHQDPPMGRLQRPSTAQPTLLNQVLHRCIWLRPTPRQRLPTGRPHRHRKRQHQIELQAAASPKRTHRPTLGRHHRDTTSPMDQRLLTTQSGCGRATQAMDFKKSPLASPSSFSADPPPERVTGSPSCSTV